MFILTARLTRRKLAGTVIAAGFLLCAFIIMAANRDALPKSSPSVPQSGRLVTNDDRLAYIASLGWDVFPDPEEFKEVLLPETFDDVYLKYNELQLTQGFDLKKYSGKKVEQVIYRIRNTDTDGPTTYLCILISNNRVIGGDVHSAALDGFMQGLVKKS